MLVVCPKGIELLMLVTEIKAIKPMVLCFRICHLNSWKFLEILYFLLISFCLLNFNFWCGFFFFSVSTILIYSNFFKTQTKKKFLWKFLDFYLMTLSRTKWTSFHLCKCFQDLDWVLTSRVMEPCFLEMAEHLPDPGKW